MAWYDYLIGFAQAIVAGIIGAWVVHILDYRKFRREEKYRDEQKKRDALRDFLGDAIPDMMALMSNSVSQPHDATLREKAGALHKRAEILLPLFHSNKKASEALTRLGNTVGTASAPDGKFTTNDFNVFYDDVQTLKNELATLDKSLST